MLKEEIFARGVRTARADIEKEIARLESTLSLLREECLHPNVEKKYRSNSGNYDPSADCEWYEFNCPDCGKRWTEEK